MSKILCWYRDPTSSVEIRNVTDSNQWFPLAKALEALLAKEDKPIATPVRVAVPTMSPQLTPLLDDRQPDTPTVYVDGVPIRSPTEIDSETPAPHSPLSAIAPVSSSNSAGAREVVSEADLVDAKIPQVGDKKAPMPRVGEHDISPAAIRQRANRVFTPRADGTLKVSQKIFDEWKSKGKSRKCLEAIFKQCGYDPEARFQTSMYYVFCFSNRLGWNFWKLVLSLDPTC